MKSVLLKLAEESTELAKQMNYAYYWEVDGFKLNNINLVKWYEKHFNTWADFVCRPDLMQKFRDVLKDKHIDMSHNYNLDMIKKIKQDYDHVQLLFSGGYDSTLVFKEFVEHGFKVDETVMQFYTPTEEKCNEEFRECGVELLKDWKHMVGTETYLQSTENDLLNQYQSEYAFFEKPMCGQHMPERMGHFAIEHHYKGASMQSWGDSEMQKQLELKPNSCFIKCIDKPQLTFYKNKWYVSALDGNFGDRNGMRDTIHFWLHPDNVKGYIQMARKYRDFVLDVEYGIKETKGYEAHKLHAASPDFDPNGTLAFFSLADNYEFNHIVGRGGIHNEHKKLAKADKFRMQRTEFIARDRWDVGCAYARCMSKFLEIFPECSKGFESFNNQGKFAWLIDIDSLEIFTQQELIPNGFEDISTVRVQGLPYEELAKTGYRGLTK